MPRSPSALDAGPTAVSAANQAAPPPLLAEQAAMVRKETIANTIASVVIAAMLTWLIFHGRPAIPALDSPPGGIFGIFPGTFNFTLLVTIALTLIVRKRVNTALVARRVAVTQLPTNVLLRGLVLALAATTLMAPTGLALVYMGIHAGLLPALWSLYGMMGFFVSYFALLSVLITPVIVRRALSD